MSNEIISLSTECYSYFQINGTLFAGKGSPPKRQQSFSTTKNKMRCSQGVAMVFEDAFVVFSRFLSLKSRGCALLETHRQRETTGIKKLYNSFFVMF
ncbi:hypothetical protein ALC62_04938 [Cyphomyrmex costatus]|uniref:Uncharacterized protein n=1 Tax=Cyphomyrmex costatus TaxID=456900 RepID=A0A195CU03_9HYME|nr:hypothetical protein ALC62_04938 [Cyphomyrmex costatus]